MVLIFNKMILLDNIKKNHDFNYTHLNLCVLSNITPHITELNIPVQTIVKPIRPASSSCP